MTHHPDPLWRRAVGALFTALALLAFLGALLGWWGALEGPVP